jgi:hypothetical protein
VLIFYKINTRNNCNFLALKNAVHICLMHLIAVDSGNVESSKRVRTGWWCGHHLWLNTTHWNLSCRCLMLIELINVKQVNKFSIYIFFNEKYKK